MRKTRLILFPLICALICATILCVPADARDFRQEGQVVNRPTAARGAEGVSPRTLEDIRRRLVTLPYYDVFDWLEGEVRPDGTVVLRGQVVRATTRSGAEQRVEDIEGVTEVVNEIEVLPPSPGDDRLRVATYRAIYNFNSPLFRYATRAVPPIHIIVNRGRITLKGVVATQMDKQLAYNAARNVRGAFEVRNELVVERDTGR